MALATAGMAGQVIGKDFYPGRPPAHEIQEPRDVLLGQVVEQEVQA